MILRTCLSIEKGLGQDGVAGWRGKEDLRLAGHGLVRRRHTHVGAPDNRINGSITSLLKKISSFG